VARTAGVFGVVLSVSVLEGLWAWLWSAAIAEVAGQGAPSLVPIALWMFIAWLAARILTQVPTSLDRRRLIVIGGGIALAVAGGTIQSGFLQPFQFFVGGQSPDLRGAGVALMLPLIYLWGRGLALSSHVSRERVLNHIASAAVALIAILLFLPLTTTVLQDGLPVVVSAFLLAVLALLLTQLAEAESHKLTRLQWAAIAATGIVIVVIGSSIVTGSLSSTVLGMLHDTMGRTAAFLSPLSFLVFFGAGLLAQYLVQAIQWAAAISGQDPTQLLQAVQQAENSHPNIDAGTDYGPPELVGVFVSLMVTVLILVVVVTIFYRVVYRRHGEDEEAVTEAREHAQGDGWLSALRRLWGGSGQADKDLGQDERGAIRRQYREFQRILADADHPRAPSQTATEYQVALARELPAIDAPASQLTELYEVARYAATDSEAPSSAAAHHAFAEVRAMLQRTPPTHEAPSSG